MKRLVSKTPDDMNLHLKRLLNERGITAKRLSQDTGLAYQRLSRAWRGERYLDAKEIKTIANYLHINDITKYFMGGAL